MLFYDWKKSTEVIKILLLLKMRLSIEKRLRVVQIYEQNQLCFSKNRFEKLRELVCSENIIISVIGLRNIIKKLQTSGLYLILSFKKSIWCYN